MIYFIYQRCVEQSCKGIYNLTLDEEFSIRCLHPCLSVHRVPHRQSEKHGLLAHRH